MPSAKMAAILFMSRSVNWPDFRDIAVFHRLPCGSVGVLPLEMNGGKSKKRGKSNKRNSYTNSPLHYNDVIMDAISSQITNLMIVYSEVYSDADQRKHQSSASLAFVRGIHRDRWIPRTNGQ